MIVDYHLGDKPHLIIIYMIRTFNQTTSSVKYASGSKLLSSVTQPNYLAIIYSFWHYNINAFFFFSPASWYVLYILCRLKEFDLKNNIALVENRYNLNHHDCLRLIEKKCCLLSILQFTSSVMLCNSRL